MKGSILIISLICLLCGAPTLAQEPNQRSASQAEILLKSLRAKDILRVDFKEEVQLPFIKEPLKSSGQLVVHPKRGIIRKVLAPIASVAVFDGNRIKLKDSSGSFTVDRNTAPQVVSAMVLWRSLVSDTEPLDKSYDVSVARKEDGRWSVTLKSRDEGAIFKECVVFGKDDLVLGLDLEESEHVKRHILFGPPSHSAELTTEEATLFESL